MDPISPLEKSLFDDLRAESPPPEDAARRVRAKLAAAIPDMRRGVSGGDGVNGVRRWRGGIGWPLATFVLGGVVGAAAVGAIDRGRPARAGHVDRAVVERGAEGTGVDRAIVGRGAEGAGVDGAETAPTLGVGNGAGAGVAIDSTPSSQPVAVAPVTQGKSTAPASSSQLSAERRLLDRARAALVAEDPNRALDGVAAHLARFPNGFLAEEREAIAIQALVKAGRYDDARTRARAFHARSPDSLFASAVDSVIGAIP